MIHQDEIVFETKGHGEMRDLTPDLVGIVRVSGIRTGTAHLFNVGSTGVLTTIEFEEGLRRDLPEALDRLLPPSREYGHEQAWADGNGHSHLQASTLGPDLTVPVTDGAPKLGTWQQVVHLECDVKPHRRRVVVTVSGE